MKYEITIDFRGRLTMGPIEAESPEAAREIAGELVDDDEVNVTAYGNREIQADAEFSYAEDLWDFRELP